MKKIIGILMLLTPVLADAEVPWADSCSKTENGCTSTYTQFGGADSPNGQLNYVKEVECKHNGVITYQKTWYLTGSAYQYCQGWDSGNG